MFLQLFYYKVLLGKWRLENVFQSVQTILTVALVKYKPLNVKQVLFFQTITFYEKDRVQTCETVTHL